MVYAWFCFRPENVKSVYADVEGASYRPDNAVNQSMIFLGLAHE